MIKKIACGIVMVAGFISCTDDYTDWAEVQTNPQEEEKSVALETATAADVDFAANDSAMVQLFVPTVTATDEYTTSYKVTLWNAEKTSNVALDANEEGYASAEDVKTAVTSLYGKRPVARKVYLDIEGYMLINGQSIKTVTEDSINVTLVAPYISTAYYIIGAPSEWNVLCKTLPFTHSGKDVYEDPVFTVTFPVTNGEYWFAITDDKSVAYFEETGSWDMVLGCAEGNGNNGMEGAIARRSEIGNDGSWKVVVDGALFLTVTINMMDYTYSIKEIVPEYYVVGAMQGWSDTKKTCMLYPQSPSLHSYTTKFVGEANLKIWLGSDFGIWDLAYGSVTDGDNSVSGTLVGTSAGAMVCPEKDAYYTLTVDFSAMEYTWTKLDTQSPTEYSEISLVGAFNGWKQDDTAYDMMQVTPHNWYIENVELTVTDGLKFNADNDWAISWGGDNVDIDVAVNPYGKLTTNNGKNVTVPAGKYNVFFNDITGEYVFLEVE